MLSRITLVVLAAFWLCMNFLLWRSEYGWRNHIGAKVPVAVVWQKILTAPDNSGLTILHHGKETGRCQWSPNVGQDLAASKILTDGIPLDGAAQKPSGSRVDFEGSFALADTPSRLGFNVYIVFSTNNDWQEISIYGKLRPDTWYVHSKASEQTLLVRSESADEPFEHLYRFSDLQNPQFLLREFQLPISLELFDALGITPVTRDKAALSSGLDWEARSDWVTLGHTSVRAYRLQARIFDRYRIIIMVSQVGEILRVELPDEWTLINTQFSEF